MEERLKSTHKVEVVPVKLEVHPNADRLSIVHVFGYTCVVGTEFYQGITYAPYITPDSMVPRREPFLDLFEKDPGKIYDILEDGSCVKNKNGYYYRITVKRFRGILSMGYMIPTQSVPGSDLSEELGIRRYEPYFALSNAENQGAPSGIYAPKYDVDALLRYQDVFQKGEMVVVTEKLHGENWRAVYDGEHIHVGSHTQWKKEGHNTWWQILTWSPEVKEYLLQHPRHIVYGESIGAVDKFPYGVPKQQRRLRIFDIMNDGKYIDAQEFVTSHINLPRVPLLDILPYDMDVLNKMVTGQSTLDQHIREGIVIKPLTERRDDRIGRVVLKLINPKYLEKSSR